MKYRESLNSVKITMVIFLYILFAISCSKKKATEPEPPEQKKFTLYVDNQTELNYGVYVDETFVDSIFADSSKELGKFEQSDSTYLEAKSDERTFTAYVDTRELEEFTWVLKIRMFTLIVQNTTSYNIEIYVDSAYVGISHASSTLNMGEFEQSLSTHLLGISYPYYWEEIVVTLGKEQLTWVLGMKH